jgi:transcriptional regulator NrdR family protein
MKCPQCEAWTEVRETRQRTDGTKRRRYECANLHRFTTVERIEEAKRGRLPRQKDPAT